MDFDMLCMVFWKLVIMLEWWEREHELDDALVLNVDITLNVLRECGLYKFFMCLNMRSQPLLLQHLVDMWDLDAGHFVVGDHILRSEIEHIFIDPVVL